MPPLTRNRALAVPLVLLFVAALALVGVRPAHAAEDPTASDPAADTNAPGPVGDGADDAAAAPAVDPGMDAAAFCWSASSGRRRRISCSGGRPRCGSCLPGASWMA